MRRAAALLAVLFVPFAALAGMQRAEAPDTASITASIAGALAGGAIALWVFGEAVAWWRARSAGGAI